MNLRSFSIEMGVYTDGYLYLIQMDRIGPIKVGFAKNVGKRLIALQTSSPYPLKLLCMMPANKDMERDFHNCFQAIRVEGEWFLPHQKLLDEVDHINHWNKINGFQPEKANSLFDFHPPMISEEYDEWLNQHVKCKNRYCKSIFAVGRGWKKLEDIV